MPKMDRQLATNKFLDENHPGLPDWVRDTIAFRVEYAWLAVLRFAGFASQGDGFRNLVRRMTLRALQDLEAGVLERIV